jgi:transcriptional regulator with XRE-family HTH domain
MRIDELLTDDAVLAELGRRLERHRLGRNRTQAQMAQDAGIGRATLQRMERGEAVRSDSLIKLLRALGLLAALDVALPESVELPIAELERAQRRVRRRARGRRGDRGGQPSEQAEPTWRWGDEPEAGG